MSSYDTPDGFPLSHDQIMARAQHDRAEWIDARLDAALGWLRDRLTNRLPLSAREA